jgi:hypothetical protein
LFRGAPKWLAVLSFGHFQPGMPLSGKKHVTASFFHRILCKIDAIIIKEAARLVNRCKRAF